MRRESAGAETVDVMSNPVIIDSGPSPRGVIQLPLVNGGFAIIDAIDAAQAKHEWRSLRTGSMTYAVRNAYVNGKRVLLYLHREILQVDRVDHKDRDGLNCRRLNLRRATRSQNQFNRGPEKGNRSGFKGVSWDAERQKWFASIRVNGKTIALGRFDDARDAAKAYDCAAKKYHGEFACLNLPEAI